MKVYPQEVYLHGLGKFPDYVYSVDISWSNQKDGAGGDEAWKQQSYVVTGGADSIARVWTIENYQLKIHSELQGHSLGVNCVRFSPDGLNNIATGSDDGKIVVWRPVLDTEKGENQIRWIAYKVLNTLDEVTHVSWSPCGQLIAGAAQREMSHLYNIHTGRALQRLDGHNNRVLGVTWDPLGQLIVSQSTDRSGRVYARSKRGTWYVKAQIKEAPLAHVVPCNGDEGGGGLTEKKWKLFISESHYPNDPTAHFFRRPEFSPDGSMVVFPGGLSSPEDGISKLVVHMFNRKQLLTNGNPTAVFTTPCSPSIAVRFHPRPFRSTADDGHRFFVFAITTATSFYVMRSDKMKPIAFGTDLHCTSIVDAGWSSDATKLILCSTDGYMTLIDFAVGELGGEPDWTVQVGQDAADQVGQEDPDQVMNKGESVQKRENIDHVMAPAESMEITQGVGQKRRITPTVVVDRNI